MRMFFDVLKRDLKRKKTMNIIILLFVILSVMFISSSASNLSAVTGSLDSFFDKAGVGDYMTFERSGGSVSLIIPERIGCCRIQKTDVSELKSFIEAGL